jgi:hypothetical protein
MTNGKWLKCIVIKELIYKLKYKIGEIYEGELLKGKRQGKGIFEFL